METVGIRCGSSRCTDEDDVGERYVLAAGAVGDHAADIDSLREGKARKERVEYVEIEDSNGGNTTE